MGMEMKKLCEKRLRTEKCPTPQNYLRACCMRLLLSLIEGEFILEGRLLFANVQIPYRVAVLLARDTWSLRVRAASVHCATFSRIIIIYIFRKILHVSKNEKHFPSNPLTTVLHF